MSLEIRKFWLVELTLHTLKKSIRHVRSELDHASHLEPTPEPKFFLPLENLLRKSHGIIANWKLVNSQPNAVLLLSYNLQIHGTLFYNVESCVSFRIFLAKSSGWTHISHWIEDQHLLHFSNFFCIAFLEFGSGTVTWKVGWGYMHVCVCVCVVAEGTCHC